MARRSSVEKRSKRYVARQFVAEYEIEPFQSEKPLRDMNPYEKYMYFCHNRMWQDARRFAWSIQSTFNPNWNQELA